MLELHECSICHKPNGKGKRELHPYGVDGALVCAGCFLSNKSLEKIARGQFKTELEKASKDTDEALVGYSFKDGPILYTGKREGKEH